jgi:LysM repeat protein
VQRDDWRRYAAPAAFLLAVTVAVVLIRSGLHAGRPVGANTPAAPTVPHKRVSTTTTTHVSTSKSTAKGYWTVKAGDTFGVISSQTGVPLATLQQLNPKVSSTSLFIGEKIRVK